MATFLQNLRSLRHGFWLGVSEGLRWSRGVHRETPAGELELPGAEGERIAALRARYQVRFESRLSAASSRRNYEYLDLLDRGWDAARVVRPAGGVLVDVGCASFWYVAALAAFFAPARIIGVDVEGHRLFRDGRSRIDHARGYLVDIPDASFVVGDYTRLEAPADVITAWFPFLTPAAILAWRLPLSLLAPERLFERVRCNLTESGVFFMANHGPDEARQASLLCDAAGLRLMACHDGGGALSAYRTQAPMLSWWGRV